MKSNPQVRIDSGVLEGYVCVNEEDNAKEYYSFQGIPYARPPVGDLRFKAPQPVEPWEGVKEVKEDGDQCFSRNMLHRSLKLGSEDCLTLNVYTPELPTTERKSDLKPVMVFIHGGAYNTGSNSKDIYGPEFLIREDVIIVVINYRLGILGFLCLEDTTLGVPGNAALKDMVLALKWVKNNINHFSGDPENVTIFGESAGGASVHLLVLSPMAKGLFHKAIAQSGSGLSLWARSAKIGSLLAEKIGINKNNEKKLLKELTNMPVEKIHELQESLPDPWDVSILRPFGFVLENPDQNEEPFLTEDPVNIIANGKYSHVPFLLGYNSREGMLVHVGENTTFKDLIPNIENTVPYYLGLKKGTPISKRVANEIMKFYFGDKDPDKSDADLCYKIWSDNFFIKDIYHSMVSVSKTSRQPVYVYEMTLETSINLFKNFSGIKEPGVCHADDIAYLFKTAFHGDIEPNSPEDIGIRRFCKLWTNFAKYGNPNPRRKEPLLPVVWKPFKPTEKYYLNIGRKISLERNPLEERMKFWDEIYTYRNREYKL